jgi:hypothetical protein
MKLETLIWAKYNDEDELIEDCPWEHRLMHHHFVRLGNHSLEPNRWSDEMFKEGAKILTKLTETVFKEPSSLVERQDLIDTLNLVYREYLKYPSIDLKSALIIANKKKQDGR